MADNVFDLSKFTITFTIDGVPVDGSAGLSVESDFLDIEKANKDEVTTRRGTNSESYSANSVKDDSRNIKIVYLPSAAIVPTLQAKRTAGGTFGILVKNGSSPGYTFTATKCVFSAEPKTVVNGKTGFKDYEFEMRALDGVQVWTVSA